MTSTRPQGWTALIYAVRENRSDTIRQLLRHAQLDLNIVDKRGRTALDHALTRGESARW